MQNVIQGESSSIPSRAAKLSNSDPVESWWGVKVLYSHPPRLKKPQRPGCGRGDQQRPCVKLSKWSLDCVRDPSPWDLSKRDADREWGQTDRQKRENCVTVNKVGMPEAFKPFDIGNGVRGFGVCPAGLLSCLVQYVLTMPQFLPFVMVIYILCVVC